MRAFLTNLFRPADQESDVPFYVAAALLVAATMTITMVPLADLMVTGGDQEASPSLLGQVWDELLSNGPLPASRRFMAEKDDWEGQLEDNSTIRRLLLPPVQYLLLEVGGTGNDRVVPAADQWLYYRTDIDHVMGPAFLSRSVQRRRIVGSPPGRPAVQPDPIRALIDFQSQLEARGIKLLVLPVPVKPTIHPELLSSRTKAPPVGNASYAEFLRRLAEAEVETIDLVKLFQSEWAASGPLYLRRDTHWSPTAVELAAQEVAQRAAPYLDPISIFEGYQRREVVIDGRGDTAAMLELPPGRLETAERVRVARVFTADGQSWKSRPDAEILLLGDSFTNVYSDSSLGWGEGGGLAEQLAFVLQRAVEKLAQNAGGASSTRLALQRDLSSGRDRLADKRVVVYQFATRELSFGDWRRVVLDAATE